MNPVLLSTFAFVAATGGSSPVVIDFCQILAKDEFGVASHCISNDETCFGMYRRGTEHVLVYIGVSDVPDGDIPLSCNEAGELVADKLRTNVPSDIGLRTDSLDTGDNSEATSAHAAIESVHVEKELERILTTITSHVLPIVLELQFVSKPLPESIFALTESILSDIRLLGSKLPHYEQWHRMAEYLKRSPLWRDWRSNVKDLALLASSTRFSDEEFNYHVFRILGFAGELSSSFLTVTVLNGQSVRGDDVALTSLDSLRDISADSEEILKQLSDPNRVSRDIEPGRTDIKTARKLEAMIYLVSTSASEFPNVHGFLTNSICPSLPRISKFITWAMFPTRNSIRMIVSLVEFCKPSSPFIDRFRAVSFLPALEQRMYQFWFSRWEGKRYISIRLPSEPSAMLATSIPFLEDPDRAGFGKHDIIVKINNDETLGHEGPRKQWIDVLAAHYFDPQFWESSSVFVRPPRGEIDPVRYGRFYAVGRVIGICVRYRITVGLRLTPAVVRMLRVPTVGIDDIESIVAEEDSEFVRNLGYLRTEINWEASDLNDQIMSLFGDSLTLTNATIVDSKALSEVYIRERLYDYSFGSITPAVLAIKRGINDIIPPGFIEAFTEDEFREFIHGTSDVSSEELIAGINFSSLSPETPLQEWFRSVIPELTAEERVLFIKFVTGSRQPPIAWQSGSWMVVLDAVHTGSDSLPTASTCFNQLKIPAYPNREVFKTKLIQAIHESDTLEIV
jgi:hypothetical protein